MTIWRAFLVATVTMLMGFVGGVWFIGSGLGFQWIKLPQVAPESTAPAAFSPPWSRSRPRIEAVGLPKAASFFGGSGGLLPPADRGDLLPSPGCVWEVEPRPLRLDSDWHQTDPERALAGVAMVSPKDGRLRYRLVQSTHQSQPPVSLRVVVFDNTATRFVSQATVSVSSRSGGGFFEVTKCRWTEDPPLDSAEEMFFGVERVVPDSDRLAGEAARAEAKQKRVEILPPPRLGEPFVFNLATVDGGRVRSQNLKGKVVLLAIGGPGPLGLSPLKQIAQENKTEGFAIVAISFDSTAEDASESFSNSAGTIPLILVPNDRNIRRLWREGAEISQVPAYWLIDREGVLRFQPHWSDLSDRVGTLLGRPPGQAALQARLDANSKTPQPPGQGSPPRP